MKNLSGSCDTANFSCKWLFRYRPFLKIFVFIQITSSQNQNVSDDNDSTGFLGIEYGFQ
jgi:hypothetical protein